MALATYLTAVQNLLGTGGAGNLYPNATLTTYINTARSQIAAEGQCVRALPPISGPITIVTIQMGGSGYGSPTVILSAPDSPSGQGAFPSGQQASATATVSGTSITAVTLSSTGQGYFTPIVTFSGAGTGAVAIAVVSGIAQTVINQEVYPFATFNPLVATSGSGISSVYMVNGVSMVWATFRYTLERVSFSKYQARVRNYTTGYTYIPGIWSQFGQGANGSLYVYPIPNAAYQMELDCLCLPINLATDTDPEALPYPWSDAVPFLAAYYAYQGSQRNADADRMWNEFQKFMKRARQMSNPRSVSNWYGRAG